MNRSKLQPSTLPLSVVATGYFDGHTGYNIHTQHFFAALAKYVQVHEIDLQDTARTNRQKLAHIEQFHHQHPELGVVNIHINYGNQIAQLLELPGRHILFTVWESTRYPADWLPGLQAVHEIWTPSHWGRDILCNQAISPHKVAIVPEGFEPALFHPQVVPEIQLQKYGRFRFIHVGKFEERKGSQDLLESFAAEFADDTDVYLVLVSHNPFVPDFNLRQRVQELVPQVAHRVLCVDPVAEHSKIAALYTACHAAVFPTRAEGWGLPILEAMACGLPTLATNYSAVCEYLNEDVGYPLHYTLTDVPRGALGRSESLGQWAAPDRAHLRQRMREIYQNQEKAQVIGAKAASVARAQWTWDHAAQKAITQLLKNQPTENPNNS